MFYATYTSVISWWTFSMVNVQIFSRTYRIYRQPYHQMLSQIARFNFRIARDMHFTEMPRIKPERRRRRYSKHAYQNSIWIRSYVAFSFLVNSYFARSWSREARLVISPMQRAEYNSRCQPAALQTPATQRFLFTRCTCTLLKCIT